MKDETIVKIKTSNLLANKWTKKSKSLEISRSDYLHNLLLGRESFPASDATPGDKQLPRSTNR